MKQALNILIAYLTCTDPVIQNKWLNLLHSFWHKDSGWLLKSITTVSGGYRFTVVDGDGNETSHDINIPTLPNSQPISYIQGLQSALDEKVDKVPGKGLSTQDFTTALKNKLDGLQNYVHPQFHQISDIQGLQSTLDNLPNIYESLSNKGANNGYTPLDSDGKIPQAYLPAVTITETFVEGSEASMLALTAQIGDVCVRTDESKSYILQGPDPTVSSNWQELLSPTGGVSSVNGLNGSLTLDLSLTGGNLGITGGNTVNLDTRYSQLGHNHNWSDITNTPTTLAGYGITNAYTKTEVNALIPTDNASLTNGAGYITSPDGGNAATLDGLDSSQFLRSDTSDTMNGSLTITSNLFFTGGSNDWSLIPLGNNIQIRNTTVPYTAMLFDGANKRVGVNTVSPSYTLDVSGDGRFTGNITAPNIITNETDTYTGTDKAAKIITLTQAEYDAIGTKNASTLYIIV
ncbi:hypothetical protein J1D01_10695 [Seonamhaeicola sp. NFXS20]|uniref:phage upper tail fiber protein n=1 Tax=Seonamhaeicola sp. NFXS20 TaxID=2816959 RepID=UPI003B8BB170